MLLGAPRDPTKGWGRQHRSSTQRPWARPHGLPDPGADVPLVWYGVGRQQGWLLR